MATKIPPAKIRMKQIDNLTGLRAYAALSVVLLHMRTLFSYDGNPFDFIFSNGGNGVQVFFVLSGFILAYTHGDRFRDGLTVSNYLFFVRLRFARIYPVHLFMLLVVTLQLWLWRGFDPLSDTVCAFVANITLTQAWGTLAGAAYNQPAWTISAEWFAYLLFPVLALTSRSGPFAWLLLSSATIAAIPAVSRFMFTYGEFTYGAQAILCGLYVSLGFFAYQLCRRLPDWRLFWRVSAIVMGPVLVALIWHTLGMDVFAIATAFLMMALFKSGPVFAYANKVSVYLGLWSYSLYMVHMPVLWLFKAVASNTPPLAIIAVMIAAAAGIYYRIEEPCREMLQKINPAIKRLDQPKIQH